MAYTFTQPGRTIMGENALVQSEVTMKKMGKKAFIISGKIVVKTGIVKLLTDQLERWGIEYYVFTDIVGEPTDEMIAMSVQAFKENACDFCIGIGGGSPLDSAKATIVMMDYTGKISDYMGQEIDGNFVPLVLIPTTAGTGSESTKFTVITDTENNVKMLLKGDALLPQLAIVDPSLTISAPQSVTAATGMDALTHAVEAYTSIKANPLTDIYAISAIKRIFEYLPKAYRDGSDEKARTEMAIAAYEAGVCINNASVTLVHGMSRPIGALFHVPHGVSNAMLMKECLTFALDGDFKRFGDIGRAIGSAGENDSDESAAKAFIRELDMLCKTCEIPSLQEYGIMKCEFEHVIDKMAADALASGSPANTRKALDKKDIINIYEKLW